jgi:hypothetical protein
MLPEMVGNREGRHLAVGFECFAEIFRQALARPLFGDHVFEASKAAIAAVAMIGCSRSAAAAASSKFLGSMKATGVASLG